MSPLCARRPQLHFELRRIEAEAAPPPPPLPILPETPGRGCYVAPRGRSSPSTAKNGPPGHQEYTPGEGPQDALAKSREFEVRKLSEGVYRVEGHRHRAG